MIPEDDDLPQDETSSNSEPAALDPASPPEWSAEQEVPESAPGLEQAAPDMSQEADEKPAVPPESAGETAPESGDAAPSELPASESDATSATESSAPFTADDHTQVQDFDRGSVSREVHRSGSADSGKLTQANDAAPASPDPSPAAGSQPPEGTSPDNPRLRRTADGGPPLARPIVLVSLKTDDLNAVVEAALKLAIDRDTRTLNQIAETKVTSAFTQYKTQQRILAR